MNRRGFLAAAVAVVAALTAFGGLNVGVSDMCSDDPGRFYVPALTKVGHQAEVIPFCTDTNLLREAVRKFDLVLFTGGEDVNPARYGAAPSPKLGRMNLRRDEYEFALFAACVAERKPVFGICRGVQSMNVFFGGTLYQDIGSDYKLPEGAEAVRHGGLPFFNGATNPPLHSITATPGSRLGRVIGNTPLKVNSFHHQGVRDVAPGFRVAARSEDGFIEAIESSDYPAAGVQFHPEHTIYYRPDTGFEIDRFEDLMKHVMAFVDLKETSVPDHTANPSEVARFRDAAIAIARRKLAEVDAGLAAAPAAKPLGRRLSTGGGFHGFFVWDSAFAVLWARYLDGAEFPYHSTLDNFYTVAGADGFISREYTAAGDEVWSSDHPISFAPPLLSWAEIALYRDGRSDLKRIARVYPCLKRHHEACRKRFRRPDGLYFGDQFGCGMDDIPRWPRGISAAERIKGGIPFVPESVAPGSRTKIWNWLGGRAERFSWNRQAGWIDLSSQMAFDCLNLAEMSDSLGLHEDAAAWRREHAEIAAAVNAKCWDEERGFYFDVCDSGRIDRCMAAAYWTLLAKIPSQPQARRMVEKLFDPKFFGTPVMLASLARCDPDYNPEHGYWTGPAWPPTTYMTICGLKEYGFAKEAEEVAKRWYNGAYEIFLKTGTLWENWSPEQWDEQKGWAAKDFCGWTALAPIALPAEFGWGPTSR